MYRTRDISSSCDDCDRECVAAYTSDFALFLASVGIFPLAVWLEEKSGGGHSDDCWISDYVAFIVYTLFYVGNRHWRRTYMMPNTALEPTPITPVSFRYGFPVGGSHRRRGSAFGR